MERSRLTLLSNVNLKLLCLTKQKFLVWLILFGFVSAICIWTLFFEESTIRYENRQNFHSIKLESNGSQKCSYGRRGPKILCSVMTHFGNLETKAMAVFETWGKQKSFF